MNNSYQHKLFIGKGNISIITKIENKTTTKALMLKPYSHNVIDSLSHTLQTLQISLTNTLSVSYTSNDFRSINVLS